LKILMKLDNLMNKNKYSSLISLEFNKILTKLHLIEVKNILSVFIASRLRNSTPAPKKIQLRMLCKFDNDFKLPTANLPEGYIFSFYQPGDELSWVELLKSSSEFGNWNEEHLQNEILRYLLPGGGIFVTFDDKLVGCAAACQIASYMPYAVLMYVLVLPEHRNRGLGKALTTNVMEVALRFGYPGMILQTDDRRRSAIHTYYDLGFQPDTSASSDAQQRWENIFREENILQ
jgi:GNAT superfamily N-acetyltransferase